MKQVQGVYERPEGSGHWYGRYKLNGRLMRKAFGDDKRAAIAWVEGKRSARHSGAMTTAPAEMERQQTPKQVSPARDTLLGQLCDLALAHSKRHHRDQLNPPVRIRAIRKQFGHRVADSITPTEIEDWLENFTTSAGTSNRYKSTFSLIFRLGMRARMVDRNPVRDFPARRVAKRIMRCLLPDEEVRLRRAIKNRFPHHMPELDIALNTGK